MDEHNMSSLTGFEQQAEPDVHEAKLDLHELGAEVAEEHHESPDVLLSRTCLAKVRWTLVLRGTRGRTPSGALGLKQ